MYYSIEHLLEVLPSGFFLVEDLELRWELSDTQIDILKVHLQHLV